MLYIKTGLKFCTFDGPLWASQVALVVKNLLAQWRSCRRCRFDPWVRKIPWRRAWKPTPVFLPGESHGQRSLEGYSPWSHSWTRLKWLNMQHIRSIIVFVCCFELCCRKKWKKMMTSGSLNPQLQLYINDLKALTTSLWCNLHREVVKIPMTTHLAMLFSLS